MMSIMDTDQNTELQLVIALDRTATTVVRAVDRGISAHHGLGLSDLGLLLELADAPGGKLRRSELAERLGITPSGVARQLAPLERIGVVDRESNPKDARLALVVLTKAGRQLAKDASVTAQEAAERVLAGRWPARDQISLGRLIGVGT